MQQLTLNVADGGKMQAYASLPPQKTGHGIVILQEAFGVNDHIKDLTRRFAEQGYAAIAPELYHRTAPPGFTAGYGDFEKLAPHMSGITEAGIQQDVRACFDWLSSAQSATKIAAAGYCMGGRAAFIANAAAPLSCAVSYYGGRIAPNHLPLAAAQKSPLLFFWGNLDKHIPNEQVQAVNQALTAAQKKFTCVQISDADHGFFCDERPSYNPVAARQAWALTLAFLREHGE